MNNIELIIEPREELTWDEFREETPPFSIALDGYVTGPPAHDEDTQHVNFDHHEGVHRPATMSSAMQAMYAVKGGLMKRFRDQQDELPRVYVNDCDQDVSLAVFVLENYKLFEGTQSHPGFNRLLEIDQRLDITAGAYPMNHDVDLVKQHHWVFEPYGDMRKSGRLYSADASAIRDNIETTCGRIMQLLIGNPGTVESDTRHEIFYQGDDFWMAHEIGGPDSRYDLFSQGMMSFVNKIGEMPNGNNVMSVGRVSTYVDFPLLELYPYYNEAEKDADGQWNGSTLIGGSPRGSGTSLSIPDLRDITIDALADIRARRAAEQTKQKSAQEKEND